MVWQPGRISNPPDRFSTHNSNDASSLITALEWGPSALGWKPPERTGEGAYPTQRASQCTPPFFIALRAVADVGG